MYWDRFARYLAMQKEKDLKTIERAIKRWDSYSVEDKSFKMKVQYSTEVMYSRVSWIVTILQEYMDTSFAEFFFGIPFDKEKTQSILMSETFMAFLCECNLRKRAINLSFDDRNAIKFRLYLAILNFDEYAKQSWCG